MNLNPILTNVDIPSLSSAKKLLVRNITRSGALFPTDVKDTTYRPKYRRDEM